MKVERFNKINEESTGVKPRYEIRNIQLSGWRLVPPEDEGEYITNYQEYNLKSVVSYIFENSDNHSGELKVFKIIEELVPDVVIEKLTDEIKLEKDSKKYNL